MKKQYRYKDYSVWQRVLYIYHDGELVKKKVMLEDELYAELEKLEADGYTMGYTLKDVATARKVYKKMSDNLIEGI